MSEMELSPDGNFIYVRVAGAVIKIDAVTMDEVARHHISEETVEFIRRYERLTGNKP